MQSLTVPILASKRHQKAMLKGLFRRFPVVEQAIDATETIISSNLSIGKKASLLLTFFFFVAWGLVSSAWAYTEPDDTSKFKFLYDVAVNDFWSSVAILVGLVLFIAGVVGLAFSSLGGRAGTAGVVICGVCMLAGALIAGSVGYVKKLGCLAL